MKIFRSLTLSTTSFFLLLIAGFALSGEEISWTDNYAKAIKSARKEGKPLLLLFTGSDWCVWCTKLEKEIFESREFINEAGDKLIFVKLDFPMKSRLNEKLKLQNDQLKERFSIRSFPTIIILAPDETQIGITGYRPGGGKQYAEHIMKMVNEYLSYKKELRVLNLERLTGKELKRLYQKASELGLEEDAAEIINCGVNSDQRQFFLTEKYHRLVNDGKIYDKDCVALKRYILNNDPDNKHLTHYQVAVIDFEAYCDDLEKGKCSPGFAVAPLIEYLSDFGNNDRENLCRLNMVISQVYLDRNNLDMALRYAKSSYHGAPPDIRPEIEIAIKNIEKQLSGK